jgi:hypothetical protein
MRYLTVARKFAPRFIARRGGCVTPAGRDLLLALVAGRKRHAGETVPRRDPPAQANGGARQLVTTPESRRPR